MTMPVTEDGPGLRLPPDSCAEDWREIAAIIDLPRDILALRAMLAQINGTSIKDEIVCSGALSEEVLYRAFADALGLPFAGNLSAEALLVPPEYALEILRGRNVPPLVQAAAGGATTTVYLAPPTLAVERYRSGLARWPRIVDRVAVTTPGAVRDALIASNASLMTQESVFGLFTNWPQLSARFVANAWQGIVLGALAILLPAGLAFATGATLAVLHLVASLFFLANSLVRLLASFDRPLLENSRLDRFDPSRAPTYSVLVALYREAEVVPDLIAAMRALQWPRPKLDIKFVCEADDAETIAALQRGSIEGFAEIVRVPPSQPRTKPKALNYALQLCRGDIVAIYDAEDRPDPLQLVEAWQRLRSGGETLACVQAPLDIGNARHNRLTALFAMEYRALFRGLLPWLARRGLLIPLGGTSNHFRRTALDAVMAWDPFNVTEDADLGTRLARHGYQVDVISRPTLEDAPEDLGIWLRQRTRWFKGWLQTWFVHVRSPLYFIRQGGFAEFLVLQILFVGIILSSLLHPLIIYYFVDFAFRLADWRYSGPFDLFLTVVDGMNLVLGYGGFLALAWRTSRRTPGLFWTSAPLVPLYWLLLSAAAWRAAWQLAHAPHKWEKTPHRPHRDRTQSGAATLAD